MKIKVMTLKCILIGATAAVAGMLLAGSVQAESVPDQKRLHEHRLTIGEKTSWHPTLDDAYWNAVAANAVSTAIMHLCPLAQAESACIKLNGWSNGSESE